jgi:GT2 family glycosyltransferase
VIPALIVPVLNRYDLLWDMIRSAEADAEIGEIVIIDNGGLLIEGSPHRVVQPTLNLGVAASWNLGMKVTPNAPWWAIVNSDIEFAPGDLRGLAHHMETVGSLAFIEGFAAFGIDRGALDKVGWFDENFHPAYYEDNDWGYRAHLAGVERSGLASGVKHVGSQTIGSSALYRQQNIRTFPANAAYYRAKWGGLPGNEVFTTPFDAGGDLRSWQLDVGRLASQQWERE